MKFVSSYRLKVRDELGISVKRQNHGPDTNRHLRHYLRSKRQFQVCLKFILNKIIPSLIEMDTCSRIPSYDYPWQATFPKIMIHLKYEIKALTNLSITSHQHAPKKLTDEAKFMIFIISIFLILAAIGTVITAYDSYYRTKKKRRSSDGEINIKKHIHSHAEKTSIESSGEVCFRELKTFFNCFCIYTNGGRILSTISNDGEFLWLHGIRFIGAFWTLAIHVGLFYVNSLSDLSTSKVWRNHWSAPVFLNATCIISLFFVLSFYFDLNVFDYVEQKISYFRVVSARKMTVRLLNVPQQTVSDAICRFKELDNDGRRSGSGLKRTVHNSQNDRIWCVDAPSISAIVEYRQYPKSVMVWGAICASGKTPLGFVEEGVKINQKMCQGDIIEEFVRGGKAFRKCQLDASTRLCTSLQGQKDTRVVQGEFSRHDII
ncbi:nose resistant to fluoxetine protein 6 [Trichonephila clavipes]|nr:nose resistant to fluoxetine protein 6 [Trichonephila clavipes]